MDKRFVTLVMLYWLSTTQANICDSRPCGAGGTCSTSASNPDHYNCSCYPGYLPDSQGCVDRDECRAQGLCYNGTCINTPGSFRCICNTGYTGRHCTEKANPCDSSPCLNGGTCSNSSTGSGYRCSCYAGFIQPNCLDRDECSMNKNLCYNGTCLNTPGSFRCHCANGYSGSRCTIQSNPCVPDPCLNAQCRPSNSPPGYTCTCYAGFVPPHCSDRDECAVGHDPCRNGTCVNTPGSFHCSCNDGFIGSRCEIPSDPCGSSPCLNGGKCVQSGSTYACSCLPGYALPNCNDKDECSLVLNLCHNGTCVNTLGSFRCVCNKGFSGIHCSTQTRTTIVSKPIRSPVTSMTSVSNNMRSLASLLTTSHSMMQSVSSSFKVSSAIISVSRAPTKPDKGSSTLKPGGQYRAVITDEDVPGNGAIDKKWTSLHWWVFAVVAVAVTIVIMTAASVIVLRRRRTLQSIYDKFDIDDAPSTPTSPSTPTQENPLYDVFHGDMNGENDITTATSMRVNDTEMMYLEVDNKGIGSSDI